MSNAASSFGYFVSSLFENETQAQAIAPIMVLPFVLFGGLLSNNDSMFAWLSWIQYISPIKYGAESLLANEFAYDTYEIKDEIMDFLSYDLGYLNCIFIFLGLIVVLRMIAFVFFKLLVRKFQ